MEVQFNVVDRATLIDAQQHPERHQDLVVRVSGFSAYFTTLMKTTQDEIIAGRSIPTCKFPRRGVIPCWENSFARTGSGLLHAAGALQEDASVRGYLSNIERDATSPTVATLDILCNALRIDIVELCGPARSPSPLVRKAERRGSTRIRTAFWRTSRRRTTSTAVPATP